MNHISTLLLLHVLPGFVRHIPQSRTHGVMVVLPPDTFQNGVCFGQRLELEFRRLLQLTKGKINKGAYVSTHHREVVLRKYLGSLFLLFWVLN